MKIDERFDKPPIIIGGCGRSGTSLLLSVLSAHPHVLAIPAETKALCPTAYSKKVDLNAPFLLDRLRAALQAVEPKPGAQRWCEKSPKNVLFFGRLLEFFGDHVRLINIVRDGRDVITSRHPKNPRGSWVAIDRWINDVRAGTHFDSHPQVLVVKYEDLVLKFAESVGRICEFLNEDVNALMTWHQHTTVRSHHAWPSDVAEVHGASIGKWRQAQYAEQVAEMMADSEAVSLLKHYGYVAPDTRPVGAWRPDFLMRRLKRKLPVGLKVAVKSVLNKSELR
jgi:hypothetical protein